MIEKTEAIVLRSMKYRETSRIVTFYTKEHGRISGIIKGARAQKNPYGSSLQPMSHVAIVLYRKEGRDLHAVTQCDLLTPFRSLSEDLPKMAVGMAIIELVANIAHEEETNIPLFELLVTSLAAANASVGNPLENVFQFEIRLAGILGFKPVFDQCVSCGKPVPSTKAPIRFELERGGPICSKCQARAGHTISIGGKQLNYLAALETGNGIPGKGLKELDPKSVHEMERLLEAFLRTHVTGIRPSKSEKVFSRILEES